MDTVVLNILKANHRSDKPIGVIIDDNNIRKSESVQASVKMNFILWSLPFKKLVFQKLKKVFLSFSNEILVIFQEYSSLCPDSTITLFRIATGCNLWNIITLSFCMKDRVDPHIAAKYYEFMSVLLSAILLRYWVLRIYLSGSITYLLICCCFF